MNHQDQSTNADDAAVLSKADLIPDAALPDSVRDALKHDAVARVVADLVRKVDTPANVALFGPWGSGKSSLYGMIEERIKKDRQGTALVRYDAWKFGGNSLHRNFLAHVTDKLNLTERDLARVNGTTETSRLRLGLYLWRNKGSLGIAFAVALFVGTAWMLLSALAANKWGVGVTAPIEYKPALGKALPSSGVVFGAVIAGLLLSNQSLASAVEKRTKPPLQEADQFFAAFEKMMERLTRKRWFYKDKQNDRLVVFIDELDRCQPSDVARTLTDLLTFLDHAKCVFVVAADREVLEEALDSAPQAKPIREGEPYYSTSGAFLDKVFQHQLSLPPTRPEALTVFARDLARDQGGLWRDLRAQGRVVYEDVLYSLVPTHVRSPRRIKVLMNNFATNVRVIQSRGMPWEDRVVQIAVLTVLQTEFPAVVRALLRQPRLLEAIVGEYEDLNAELRQLVSAYDPAKEIDGVGADKPATPAPLLTDVEDDEKTDRAKEARARQRLNEQLHAYLGKIHAANITLPAPDLVYAQQAAHADGLSDEDLARVLDVAADTSPDLVVAAFSKASPSDQKAGVRFLVTQLGNNFGPSRANLVEAACKIALALDPASARETARAAASTLLAEARSGRWRPESTLGALRLGLLDEQMRDPLGILSEADEIESLLTSDGLHALVGMLPEVGPRAALAFPVLGTTYASTPEVVNQAVRQWPAGLATALWDHIENDIAGWFEGAAIESVSADPATRTRPADVEAARVAEAARIARVEAQYAALIAAVVDRESNDISRVASGVARIGLMNEAAPSLHQILLASRTGLHSACADIQFRNEFALEALRIVPINEWELWAEWLEAGAVPEDKEALRVAERISAEITDAASTVEKSVLVSLFERIALWLTKPEAESVTQVLWNGLMTSPPDGTTSTTTLRTAIRATLEVLDAVYPEPGFTDGYIVESLVQAVEKGLAMPGLAEAFNAEVLVLEPEKAKFLESKIVEIGTGTETEPIANDPTTLARVRIAARSRAEMKALPVKDLLSVSPEAGDPILAEWSATKPPTADFIRVARKALPPLPAIDDYIGAKHNVAEASKVWIALERTNAADEVLMAVGNSGVSETVVAHMKPLIVGAPVAAQSDAVSRLLSANLSANARTRSACHNLAEELLTPITNGAGRNAARVIIGAGGGDPKRKKALRASFDALLTAYPSALQAGERKSLHALGLLTPVSKGPLAPLFKFVKGWGK